MWCSSNSRDSNPIDHLLIDGMWRCSLLDAEARKGADFGSNHHLVVAVMMVKLRCAGRRSVVLRHFSVEKLQEHKVRSTFNLQVSGPGRHGKR